MREFTNRPDKPDAYDLEEKRKLEAFFAKTSAPPSKEPPLGTRAAFANNMLGRVTKSGLSHAGDHGEHKNAVSYAARVKMDWFLARPDFRIKSRRQALWSSLSFFNAPPDKVSRFFVTKRLPEVCNALERLITTVRLIFPRNNRARNVWLRVHSPFSYSVLNVIRHWNIARIAGLIGRLQAHPRGVYISDLKKLTRLIYRPIVILDAVDPSRHIPLIAGTLSRLIYAGDAGSAFAKKQKKLIQNVTCQYEEVSGGVCYALYPLLMKLLSDKWYDYDTFWTELREKIHVFLDIKKGDCVIPPRQGEPVVSVSGRTGHTGKKADAENGDGDAGQGLKARQLEESLKNGLEILEILFPGSGWNQPQVFPDFYRYFVHVFDFEKGVQRLHPENPVLQIFILARILQDVLDGLRHAAIKPSDIADEVSLEKLISGWQEAVDKRVYHDYFKLLADYFDYYSIASPFRKLSYGKRVTDELHYFTKNFMLPFFDCSVEPDDVHFSVKDTGNLFDAIKALYEKFDEIIRAPDQAAFIGNVSSPFVFDIPTPVSRRLFSLFDKEQRSNKILIVMAHDITAVLHYLINSPDSWAYASDHRRKKFRSRNTAGLIPLEWQDQSLNPDNLFHRSIETLRQKAMQKFKVETKVPN
jgi:hypothetical protein